MNEVSKNMKHKIFQSSDTNVSKFVFEWDKPKGIAESVLYRYGSYEQRTVICCSVQSGCPVGCVFCGGCHVIEKVPSCYRRIANDKNNYLVVMWSMLVNTNLEFPRTITKETYSFYRSIFNKRGFGNDKITSDDAMIGWVGFMGSFNGRFFDGGYSGHCVGKRDYISEQIRNTESQIENLKGVEWNVGDYTELDIPPNSLIYCDIPYKNTTQYSISKNFDYEKFYAWCREMKSKGHIVYVSEYWMPEDFTCVWKKNVKTTMNQTNTIDVTEKLFKL